MRAAYSMSVSMRMPSSMSSTACRMYRNGSHQTGATTRHSGRLNGRTTPINNTRPRLQQRELDDEGRVLASTPRISHWRDGRTETTSIWSRAVGAGALGRPSEQCRWCRDRKLQSLKALALASLPARVECRLARVTRPMKPKFLRLLQTEPLARKQVHSESPWAQVRFVHAAPPCPNNAPSAEFPPGNCVSASVLAAVTPAMA
jgi:hypothetical protein